MIAGVVVGAFAGFALGAWPPRTRAGIRCAMALGAALQRARTADRRLAGLFGRPR